MENTTSGIYTFYNCNSTTIHNTLQESPTAPWNGNTIASGFSEGSGTADDPYVINSASELAYLAQEVNNGNSFDGVYFVLGCDLNLNKHAICIGDISHPFNGNLNGNGHVIRNLSIYSSGSCAAFIGNLGGSLYNIGFESVNIKVSSSEETIYVGLIGMISTNGTVSNIYVTGTIDAKGTTYVYAGGIAGYCEGIITNSYSQCNVSSEAANYMAYAGGLVGFLSSGSLSNCFATGNVSAKGATINYSRNGGLVGGNKGGTIENCLRSSSQVLTRNGTSGSCYNEDGTVVSFEGITGNLIIETLNWDPLIWNGSEDFPLLIKQ